MNARKVSVVVAPLLLLVALGGLRWVQWRNDHPPVTAQDVRLRRILLTATDFRLSFGGTKFTPEQQRELAEHFWTATTKREAQNPSSGNAEEAEIYFHLSPPGQAHIVLCRDPAFDSLNIDWWTYQPALGGSPPITQSEEYYDLHPATSRFLRAWLAQQK